MSVVPGRDRDSLYAPSRRFIRARSPVASTDCASSPCARCSDCSIGLPWLQWDGHQAVLFDLPARKFYIFGLCSSRRTSFC